MAGIYFKYMQEWRVQELPQDWKRTSWCRKWLCLREFMTPGGVIPTRYEPTGSVCFFSSFSSVWYDVNQEHSSSISLYFQFNRTFSRMCSIPFIWNIVPQTQGSNVKESARWPEDEEVVVVAAACGVLFSSCLKVCPKHPTLATYSPPNDIPTNQPTNQRSQADSRGWLQFGRWICLGPGGP